MILSVVLPTLNEEERIGRVLESIREEHAGELLVVDGGSVDRTLERAEQAGARTVSTTAGLANQCNEGMRQTEGDLILYLSADSVLVKGWHRAMMDCLNNVKVVAGGFRLRLDSRRLPFRLIELGGNLRGKWHRFTLPDQGMFVRRRSLERIDGFNSDSSIPFARACHDLRKLGEVVILRHPIRSSVRKWKSQGTLRTSFRHVLAYRRFRRQEIKPGDDS